MTTEETIKKEENDHKQAMALLQRETNKAEREAEVDHVELARDDMSYGARQDITKAAAAAKPRAEAFRYALEFLREIGARPEGYFENKEREAADKKREEETPQGEKDSIEVLGGVELKPPSDGDDGDLGADKASDPS
jgi:hypothetical protein